MLVGNTIGTTLGTRLGSELGVEEIGTRLGTDVGLQVGVNVGDSVSLHTPATFVTLSGYHTLPTIANFNCCFDVPLLLQNDHDTVVLISHISVA